MYEERAMTDSLTSCPSPEQLRALVDGLLPDREQSLTQEHVDGCAACQQVLESLVAGGESWDSALGHLRNEPIENRETVLSEAMRQMKAEEFVDAADSAWNSKKFLEFLTPSDQPGSIGKLGAYEVTEVVGQGGMGIVVKAFDPSLHRVVAVKVLAPYLAHNPQARKRFLREAVAIAAVSHDHIITIYAVDESVEQPKIVMQFVAGRSLQQKIDAEGSLDLKEILRIGMQTAAGLAAAHAQGLVHRDVKPSNILLENGIQRVKLTDFGLARAVDDASLTQSGVIAGTPQYMAPEQANGDAVDYRADLFSLGSVMYAMCVGHSPFRASTTMGVLKRVCHDPPRPIQELNADIPDWLCAIVMKLLAKKPEDRFSSAKVVADLLEKWLAHVQQPTVVSKPASQATPGSMGFAASPPNRNEPVQPSVSVRSGRGLIGDWPAQTVFFQTVSVRWFWFFFLVGMTVAMGVARSGHARFGEAMLVSVMSGLITSVWGLLLIALVRFLSANVLGFVPQFIDGQNLGGNENGPENLGHIPSAGWRSVPPLYFGLLTAFVAMMIEFEPVIAAILGGIAWMIARARLRKDLTTAAIDSPEDSFAFHPATANPPDASRPDVPGVFQNVLNLFNDGWSFLGGIFSGPTAASRNKTLIAIGWWLVGGVDLISVIIFWSELFARPHQMEIGLLGVATLCMSLTSLAASHCIYVRQNFDVVRTVSFLGLLPISFGAIGRIPLSVITLLWLNSAGTRESFDSTPFANTTLGRLVHGLISFVRRSIGTVGWIFLWTVGWIAVVAGVFWLYILPYGPSSYHVYDKARVKLKGERSAQFLMTATGEGASTGLIPPSTRTYRPQEVTLEVVGQSERNRLKVHLGDAVPINESTHQALIRTDIENCLFDFDRQHHRDHAKSLFDLIQRLNSRNSFTSELDAGQLRRDLTYSERMRISMELWRRHVDNNLRQPWSGFMPVSSMLDPEFFEVSPDNDLSTFDCSPETWFWIAGAIAGVIIWLFVTGGILRRRHFRSGSVS
jgi:serine/threonine protein kinase